MKISSILGLNARSRLYLRYNSARSCKIADSKIQSFRVLKKAGIPTPEIFKKFKNVQDVYSFNWDSLPSSFALKPSRGLGGQGIIVVKKRAEDLSGWITVEKKRITVDDLKLHTIDILEGAYSMGNEPDVAFLQEYVGRHKALRRYSYIGTPDIRVIVFNKIPAMAMLRLPTKESGGKANYLHGAIGVGIDIATGITTSAVWFGEYIRFKPGTNRKLHGIKIPGWTSILELAVRAQIASGLGYAGIDVVLHPEKGPMVIELNAQPGTNIQLANKAGLRKRLERVEDLEVRDAEHGVKIAKALFAGRFADRVKAEEGVKTINIWEDIKVVGADKKKHLVHAKIDTGAWKTSIDKELARSLGILEESNVLWTKTYKSSLGKEVRKVVSLVFYIADSRVATIANVADRSKLRTPVIIGRRDLGGFLVKAA
mgnify:CR=1 FL=1